MFHYLQRNGVNQPNPMPAACVNSCHALWQRRHVWRFSGLSTNYHWYFNWKTPAVCGCLNLVALKFILCFDESSLVQPLPKTWLVSSSFAVRGFNTNDDKLSMLRELNNETSLCSKETCIAVLMIAWKLQPLEIEKFSILQNIRIIRYSLPVLYAGRDTFARVNFSPVTSWTVKT